MRSLLPNLPVSGLLSRQRSLLLGLRFDMGNRMIFCAVFQARVIRRGIPIVDDAFEALSAALKD